MVRFRARLQRLLWPVLRPLITFDRVLNASTGGSIDETLSARAHRMRLAGRPFPADLIDWLCFWQDNHCRRSYEAWNNLERDTARDLPQ